MMRYTILALIPLLWLADAEAAVAGSLHRERLERYCIDALQYGWDERRAMRHLFPGRLQLTLGDSHRRHFMQHCLSKRRYHHRAIPSWSHWHDPYGRFAGHFYGFNDVYRPNGSLLRPRHGTRSFHLRYEFPLQRRQAPRRLHPTHSQTAAHLAWCRAKYRSFRASDNTFHPYQGPRKRCRSPYGR